MQITLGNCSPFSTMGREDTLQRWNFTPAATTPGCGAIMSVPSRFRGAYSSHDGRCATSTLKGMNGAPTSRSHVQPHRNAGWPTGREPQGHGAIVVVGDGENPLQGEGWQVDGI